jgi:lambda repressor-like predicted transcriptional regulator
MMQTYYLNSITQNRKNYLISILTLFNTIIIVQKNKETYLCIKLKYTIMNLRITEHCKMQGITLQELADKMGVARSTLANTLSKGNPTIETLSKIADALGVEVTDLFEKSSDEVIGAVRIGDSTHVINSKEDIKKLAEKL